MLSDLDALSQGPLPGATPVAMSHLLHCKCQQAKGQASSTLATSVGWALWRLAHGGLSPCQRKKCSNL